MKIIYTAVSFVVVGLYIIFGIIGVYRTENGIVLGLPDYEKRNVHVTQIDLDILIRADELLSSERRWEKGHDLNCVQSEKFDLYCALEKASVEVMGRYVHRQPALQEVRFCIDDHYRDRWERHRLIDFNSNKDTSFRDVKSVLAQAIAQVREKLLLYKGSESS